MAKEIGQLSVKIGLDSSGFQNGIGKLNQEMKKVQSEFKLASAEMGKHGKELDSLKLKSDSLTKQTEIQRQKVQALEAAHQKSVETKGQDAKATQNLEIKLNQAKTQLVNMENNLKTLNREIEVQSSGWGKLSKSLEPLGQSLQNVGQKMEAVGKNLSMKVTAPLAGLGAAAVKVGSDFEAGMSEVKAISGATGENFKKLQEKAKEMGATTKFSASEASEGLKYMAMAGWDTSQMLDGLEGIMMLAAASGEDLGMVSDIVTDALTAFGMEAKQAGEFADLLASASSNSNTNVAMLGQSFKYVAPLFGALGYSAEDAALALGLMANAGIKSSQAGTSLKTALANLANPTKAMGTAMDQLGISITDANGEMLPFKGVMDELRTKFANLSEEQQAQYAATIFGKEAMAGMLAIINASDEDYAKLTEATRNYTGTAKEMADVMIDNLQGSITILKSGLEGLAIQIFEILLPHLNKLVEKLQQMVDWFANLNPATQEAIVKIGLLAAAIGPVLLIGGKLIAGIGSVIGVLSSVSGVLAVVTTGAAAASPVLGALGGAFTVLTGPIGIAIAALAALVVAGVAVYKNWDEIKAFGLQLWEDLKTGWAEGMAALKEGWTEGWASIGELFQGFGEQIALAWTTLWDGLKSFLIDWWPLLLDAIIGPMGLVAGAIYNNWDEIKVKTIEVWDSIKAFCEEWWNIFTTWLSTWNPWNFVQAKWNEFKTQIMQVWDKLKTETGTWWSNFTTWLLTWNPWNFVKAKWDEFKASTMQVWDKLKTETGAWWNTFTSWLSTWNPWNFVQAKWNEFKANIMQVWDNLKTETNTWWNNFTAWLSTWNPWAAVQGLWNTWKENTIQVWRNLKNDAVTWGNNIIQGMADGIRNKLQAAVNAVSDVAESIKDKVKTAFGIASPSTVMKEYGQNISQGLAEGIDDESPSVVAVMESVIEGLQEQIDKAIAILEAFRAEAAKPIMMGPVISGGFGKGGGGGGGGGGGHGGGSVDGIGSWSGTGRYDEGSGSGKGTGQFVGGDSNNSGWEVVDKGDSYYVPGIGDVDKKAEGGILTGPRFVFAGEAGSEAILPLAKLQPMMTEALLNSIRSLNRRMIGELGPELVASPRRNRIYNDQPILGGNKGITQHITIHSPTPLTPAETARKIKNASRQLALEW